MRQMACSGHGPARQVLVEWPGDDKMKPVPGDKPKNVLGRHVENPVLRIRDVCFGSRMFIPDPRSWLYSIPDPESRIHKKEEVETICRHISQIKIILLLKIVQKKKLSNWQGKYSCPHFDTELPEIQVKGIRDPRSGIWKNLIPDPIRNTAKLTVPGPGRLHELTDTGHHIT